MVSSGGKQKYQSNSRSYNGSRSNSKSYRGSKNGFGSGSTDEESDDLTDSLEEQIKRDKNPALNSIITNISKSINVYHLDSDDSDDNSNINNSGNNNQMIDIFVQDNNGIGSSNQQNAIINNDNNSNNTDNIIQDLKQHLNPNSSNNSSSNNIIEEDADDEYEEGGFDHESSDDDDRLINNILNIHTDNGSENNVITDNDLTFDSESEQRRRRTRYVLTMDFVYLVTMLPICYFTYFIPSSYLGSGEFFAYWSYHYQWSKYILWMVSIVAGFSYVSMVTEQRSYPFHCRYKRHRDFFQLLFALSIMFWISPSRVLMGPNDINNNSSSEAFVYNYFSFVIPFILGLHYTYLDYNLFLRSVGDKFGTPSLWKTYKFVEVLVIIPIILFILALIIWHVYLIIESGLWGYFLVAYAIFFIILIGVSCLIRETHYLHMHHYFIFGSLIPLTAFQTVLSSISLGLLLGITVEGVSRWSMGFLWYSGVRVL